MVRSSRIPGFYKISPGERLKFVKEFAGLTDEEAAAIESTGALTIEQVNRMVENAVGTMEVPLGVATNFLINGKEYLVPMAIEEPSVIAAASNAAKMARDKGGFTASSTEPVMIGQIQISGLKDLTRAKDAVLASKEGIIEIANQQDPLLVKLGGGAKDLEIRELQTALGPMLVLHLLVDCRDAMGANVVNTMAEAVAPYVEELTGGKVYLRIISNLAVHRLAKAEATFSKEALGGREVVDAILTAYALAASDPYRCATHNKGIMNGITAVVLATGNDTRALESGAHAYAAIKGGYSPLTTYEKNADGDILAKIELPIAVGLVGGATAVHPVAKANIKILGVKSAVELAEVMASVGLAQNLAALRVLATEGIQKGHMALHARNIAVMAGAEEELIDEVAEVLLREKKVRIDRAREVLEQLQKNQ
ncbi:MAG: hydroxymethylglutaryl-CoA reductase, degradative [Candidatus Hydrothermarchaeales archaeon]